MVILKSPHLCLFGKPISCSLFTANKGTHMHKAARSLCMCNSRNSTARCLLLLGGCIVNTSDLYFAMRSDH